MAAQLDRSQAASGESRSEEARRGPDAGPRGPSRVLGATLIGLVRVYQWTLSSWLPPRCRYQPSCSDYAIGALRRFGPVRGGWLATRRILRCHPWGGSGYDPVPERTDEQRNA